MKRNTQYPQKILIVRTDRIGDVALSLPVVENVRKAHPDAYIAFICSPLTRDILSTNPFLDETIVYDKKGKHRGVLATLSFAFKLRTKGFDWAIILHSTNRVNWIAFLAGIKLRIGWDRKAGFLLNKRLPYLKPLGTMHERDYNLLLLEQAGIKIVSRDVRIHPGSGERQKIESMFLEYGLQDRDLLVGIHPLSSCPSKKWPQTNYETLAGILISEYKAKIIVVGGDKIGFRVDQSQSGSLLNLSGLLSLGELIALLVRLRLLVSNDSGPVHLAGGVSLPCVVLFGRKQPGLSVKRWGPLGKQDKVIHKDVGCQECLAHRCPREFYCIRSIKVEEVLECVKPFLFR